MFKNLTTTKKLIYFLFANCVVIELFVLIITLIGIMQVSYTGVNPDLTPLNTLIGVFATETVAYAVYCLKSRAENTEGGINYLNAQHDIELDNFYEEEDVEG